MADAILSAGNELLAEPSRFDVVQGICLPAYDPRPPYLDELLRRALFGGSNSVYRVLQHPHGSGRVGEMLVLPLCSIPHSTLHRIGSRVQPCVATTPFGFSGCTQILLGTFRTYFLENTC